MEDRLDALHEECKELARLGQLDSKNLVKEIYQPLRVAEGAEEDAPLALPSPHSFDQLVLLVGGSSVKDISLHPGPGLRIASTSTSITSLRCRCRCIRRRRMGMRCG